MSAYYLKWIAVILMIIDHIGFFLLPQYKILRIIGRLSFPIFAFLIANGYSYTRDVKKYFLRLFVFACIIQIPSLFMTLPVNVFFTLSFGLLSIMVFESKQDDFIKLIEILGLVYLAHIIGSDYGAYGVIMILVIFMTKERYLLMSVGILVLSVLFYYKPYAWFNIQYLAALSPFIIMFYNKKPGRKMKYFFYLFYPIHMVILQVISQYF
ncbi:conjugal transfer protein TraX [Acidaminobacter sp. JC074]|uniref:TraX family protein n=1 Tax=Acidaminobacter sp. JC074 TaxID=2530199 RepID=UPI001F0F6788|nr:TraX family protein [Acidaminobacter sp. JC074]MCH4889735.1 conjugal transfer protein TraX [Acidaminobacter sp. JC074]